MGLKCKLHYGGGPGGALGGAFEAERTATEKLLYGVFGQGFSSLLGSSSSQLMIIFSFLSVIGFLIWLVQTPQQATTTTTTAAEKLLSSSSSQKNTEEEEEEKKKRNKITTNRNNNNNVVVCQKEETSSTQVVDTPEGATIRTIREKEVETSTNSKTTTTTTKYTVDTVYESRNETLIDTQEVRDEEMEDGTRRKSITKLQTFEIRYEPEQQSKKQEEEEREEENEEKKQVSSPISMTRPGLVEEIVQLADHFEKAENDNDRMTSEEEDNGNLTSTTTMSSSPPKQQQQQQQIKNKISSTTDVSRLTKQKTIFDEVNEFVDDLVCDEKEKFAYSRNENKQTAHQQQQQQQDQFEHHHILVEVDQSDFSQSNNSSRFTCTTQTAAFSDTASTSDRGNDSSSQTTVKENNKERNNNNNNNNGNNSDVASLNSLLDIYKAKHINAIEDHFKSLQEVSAAVKQAGLENSQLIFGIDFTISNLENGTSTFSGRSLHYHDAQIRNPYQKVIEIMGKTLECFDVDGRIPAFGFGDAVTKDRKVFPFSATGYCNGFKDVLRKYNRIVRDVKLSGPTNFAPLIKEAIKIVKETKQYHILAIVADGQVTNERQTRDAIVEASKYALSIIMVGVGDGPWDTMNEFDDSLPKRQFDNFQFVNYHQVIADCEQPDEAFALHSLMEIPDQYKSIRELGLLKKKGYQFH